MEAIIAVAFIIVCAVWMGYFARSAGGGQIGRVTFSQFPEIVFALTIGGAVWAVTDHWYLGLFATIWSYIWMEAGHGNAYHMGTSQHAFPIRKQGLDVVVMPICRLFGWESRSAPYCWLFMGLKGLLIGLPIAPWGLILAVLWPLAYWYGFAIKRNSVKSEWYSGISAGILLAFYILTGGFYGHAYSPADRNLHTGPDDVHRSDPAAAQSLQRNRSGDYRVGGADLPVTNAIEYLRG